MPLGPTSPLTRRGLLGGLGAAAVLGLTVDRGAQATAGRPHRGAGPRAPAASRAPDLRRPGPGPNILLVVADDLGPR